MTEIREEYNDRYQLVSQIDEEGRLTQYQYNDWSQTTAVILADASKITFSYDKQGRLFEVVNQEGGSRKWFYHDDNTLEKQWMKPEWKQYTGTIPISWSKNRLC